MPDPATAEDGRPVGGRRGNAPTNTLKWCIKDARSTAPEGADVHQIAGVAWICYDRGRDSREVWQEVLADG